MKFEVKEGFIMIGTILAKQAVSAGFAAINQHDLATFMKAWADDAVWIFPGDLSVSGKFVGKPAVQGWFEKFFQQFPRTHFTVRNMLVADIFALTGNNVVAAEWELALTNRVGVEFQNSGVTVLTIKNAQVVKGQDYLTTIALRSGDDYRRLWGE